MRGKTMAALVLLAALSLQGCAVYDAAVDTRSVKVIAADTAIKAKILKAFFDDSVLGPLDFSVSCYNGHVYIVGEYAVEWQKERAVTLAGKVEGVRDVTTYMLKERENDACGAADNLAITAKVSAKLVEDKDIWSTNIDVKTMQCGTVVLWGLVDGRAQKDKAEKHARAVPGVKRVKNMIRVAPRPE